VVVLSVAIAVALTRSGGDDRPPAEPSPAEPSPAERLGLGGLAGQRLIAGWDGAAPPRGLRLLIRSGGLAGVILFDDNIASGRRVRRTIEGLQAIKRPDGLGDPLLVMVDQEGGQVKRLPGPPEASAEVIGTRGQSYALEQGGKTARSIGGVGFNVDLAPVLDIARPGSAIEREDRAFGDQSGQVIAAGVNGFGAGLQSRGVAATAKHFPGLGAAETNTDLASQRITLSKDELRSADEQPFEAFSRRGGELVMLSLATYPAFADRPAAFSKKIVTGELRGRLGFEGVTITDGLGAAAAEEFGPRREVALAAIGAGNDLLLYSDWRAARRTAALLRKRLLTGRLSRADFEPSVARVLGLRARLIPGSG